MSCCSLPSLQNMAVFTVGSSDHLQKIFCLVLMIMSITLNSCIFNHISLKILIYGFLSAHIRSTHTQKMAVTQHVSTKLSYLSCLIVLKQSNTHKFMRKTYELQKKSVMSEGKQLGKKLHVYIWQKGALSYFQKGALPPQKEFVPPQFS